MNRYEREALLTAISVIGAHAQDVADDELSYPNPDYRARVAAEVDEISRWLAGLLTSRTASWKQTKKGSNESNEGNDTEMASAHCEDNEHEECSGYVDGLDPLRRCDCSCHYSSQWPPHTPRRISNDSNETGNDTAAAFQVGDRVRMTLGGRECEGIIDGADPEDSEGVSVLDAEGIYSYYIKRADLTLISRAPTPASE